MESIIRCPWCESSQLYREYHDQEWGRPVRDEQRMFEFLLLETFQAGLSWITILNKRENFRSTFHSFDIQRVADMGENEIERALKNPGIIRHEGKIRAAINNAQRVLEMKSQGLSLVEFFWSYVDGKPIINTPINLSDVPAVTPLAQQIAKDLKKRGFKFVGATTIYAHMQATGMVNDHLVGCHVKSVTMRKA
jgi:DNA-3-methyladenine glycosylase I